MLNVLYRGYFFKKRNAQNCVYEMKGGVKVLTLNEALEMASDIEKLPASRDTINRWSRMGVISSAAEKENLGKAGGIKYYYENKLPFEIVTAIRLKENMKLKEIAKARKILDDQKIIKKNGSKQKINILQTKGAKNILDSVNSVIDNKSIDKRLKELKDSVAATLKEKESDQEEVEKKFKIIGEMQLRYDLMKQYLKVYSEVIKEFTELSKVN